MRMMAARFERSSRGSPRFSLSTCEALSIVVRNMDDTRIEPEAAVAGRGAAA
jgi:hypothetical protein